MFTIGSCLVEKIHLNINGINLTTLTSLLSTEWSSLSMWH